MSEYPRPTTIKELREKLQQGITCEVASEGVESAVAKLNGWLAFHDFTTKPSNSSGWWVLFVPKTAERERRTAVLNEIMAERERQVQVEGWTLEHDEQHDDDELLSAAATYTFFARKAYRQSATKAVPASWPWAEEWWKPTTPRRDLVKAAALIMAAIEQIDRLESRKDDTCAAS